MTLRINRETELCMSLAARPGNFGTGFHNFLYEELGLNFIYKAFTTRDLRSAIAGVRALGIRGCAISMPFKEDCIEFVDELDASAQGIQSVNTIVNRTGRLCAYNTDYAAVAALLARSGISPASSFVLRGSGGMAKAVACALRDAGFRQGAIAARNQTSGRALARQFDYQWTPQADCAPGRSAGERNAGWNGRRRRGRRSCFFRGSHRPGHNRLRRSRASRRDAADPPGQSPGQAGDLRCGSDRSPGGGAICALHQVAAQPGSDSPRRRVCPGFVDGDASGAPC